MMKCIERTIHRGIKEASKQSAELDQAYDKVSNRIDQARLDMQERSRFREIARPQERSHGLVL